jgi:4-hydroxybenzoate polyprenyltransferase
MRIEQILKDWVQAIRAHQWAKNVLIFVPLMIGQSFYDLGKIEAAAAGFVLLCAIASGSYIINDIVDLEADRAHPSKNRRPFASGRLSIRAGIIVAVLAILISLLIAAKLSSAFALALAGYLAGTLLYSFSFKRVPLLDVFMIGALFTSRILMGSVVSSLDLSPWLISYSMFFFFSLALAKRHAEIMAVKERGAILVAGRGYRADDWPLTLVFGIAAGLTSIVIMILYVTNDAAPSNFYREIGWLYIAPVATTLWLMRVWLLSHRMLLDDDPVVFALSDGVSWLLGLVVVGAIVLAI